MPGRSGRAHNRTTDSRSVARRNTERFDRDAGAEVPVLAMVEAHQGEIGPVHKRTPSLEEAWAAAGPLSSTAKVFLCSRANA